MQGRTGRGAARIIAVALVLSVTAALPAAAADGTEVRPIGPADPAGIQLVLDGALLDDPAGIAIRPRTRGEIWVTNRGSDSLTIIRFDGETVHATTRTDGYAEHFTALPTAIAFTADGERFAVANDSNNEVRGMEFLLNPERNVYFRGSNFMGPTLFAASTYALAAQTKAYLADWPQPGYGHDAPDDIPQDDCPVEYWSIETGHCMWPREGSHLDMLHANPLSTGIATMQENVFALLDGCGSRDAENACLGDGHLAIVDFNRDHGEGNGFHGDGIVHRYVDAPFTRVDGLHSGIVVRADLAYYADTGAGVVRAADLDSGRTSVLVGPWHPGQSSHGRTGNGSIDWAYVVDSPGDGDSPDVIDQWIAESGDPALIERAGERWIKPQETLSEYAYVYDTPLVDLVPAGRITAPTGLAASDAGLWIADGADGSLHLVDWLDGTELRTIETGRTAIAGIAWSGVEGALYLVADGAVWRLVPPAG